MLPYVRLSIPALLLIVGVEAGSWVTPLDLLSPSGLAGTGIKIALSIPMIFLAWWFLFYIRCIPIRLFGGYTGAGPPVWRMRWITLASSVWLFFSSCLAWSWSSS